MKLEFMLGMKGSFYIGKSVSVFYHLNRLGKQIICMKTVYQYMKTKIKFIIHSCCLTLSKLDLENCFDGIKV